MQDKITTFRHHPKFEYVFNWGKLIFITGGTQIILQAIGFVSGILIIRLLPIQEYALYTLANTMLGTMVVLADGGISTGVMSQGAKVWQDKEKLGKVLATGLHLRRRFAIGSIVVTTPILIYLLLHNNASWLMTLLIAASLIPAFFATLSDTVLEVIPKLHQNILPLQKNQLLVGLGRLMLTVLTIFIFPWTFVVILASGIPRIYGNLKLRQIANGFVDEKQQTDPIIQAQILQVVRKILPGAIYFCVSGQITIWLISIFGNTTSVAQLGALGRLTMILTTIGVLINTLIVPRFARLEPRRKDLLKIISYTMGLLFFLCTIIIVIVNLFPTQILLILGNSYKDLNKAMLLSVLIGCINLAVGVFISFSHSRGWVINPFLIMIFNIVGTVFPLFFVDISTLIGVLILSLCSSLWGLLIYGGYAFHKILKLEN